VGATLLAALALIATACAAPDKPTPSPSLPVATATPTLTLVPPPPTSTPTPIVESTPEAQALRLRAEAFTLARTDARFDDTYLFNTPAFREVCGPDPWFFGLIAEASFTRGWNGLDDDAYLRWTVTLVEVSGATGSTLVSVATKDRNGGERGLDLISYPWALVDGEWWLAEPPEEACVL
jgi:hypothetical protein